jgi:hypothetical protein
MIWTDKNTDQLITGAVGITGTLLGGIINAFGSRFWIWWDRKRDLKAEIRRLRLQFEHTESKSALSASLSEMKAFMVQNESTFERKHLKAFFDIWLTDPSLDSEGMHIKLMPMACDPEIKRLKTDAARLVHW